MCEIKTKKSLLNINADWSGYERRPSWSVVSSRELSEILNVSLNTICNWRLRKILPTPTTHPTLKGNKVFYRISAIRAWLENKTENEVHSEWIHEHLPEDMRTIKTLEHVDYIVSTCWNILEVEKPLIPGEFTGAAPVSP